MVSLREFARRRGVALAAVQKAIKSGRITEASIKRDDKGRVVGIDPARANREWDANTDPAEAAKSGKIIAPQGAPQIQAQPAALTAPVQTEPTGGEQLELAERPSAEDDDDANYHAERAKRERYMAAKAELDYLERIGVLASVAEFREAALELGRFFQDELMGIAARLAPQLAAESDPVRVDALLSAELRRVLNAVADGAERLAARGPGERVACGV